MIRITVASGFMLDVINSKQICMAHHCPASSHV